MMHWLEALWLALVVIGAVSVAVLAWMWLMVWKWRNDQ